MYTSLLSTLLLAPSLIAAACSEGVTIFETRGTGEPVDNTLLDIPARALMKAIPGSTMQRNDYAAADGVQSSAGGIEELEQMVTAYHNECPHSPIVLMGYSQGALVTRLSWTGVQGYEQELSAAAKKNVVGIVLYGDPLHQGSESYDRGTCTVNSKWPLPSDMATAFTSYAPIMLSFCAAGDPFCCESGTDYSAHRSYFTEDNAALVANFVKGNLRSRKDLQ